MASIEEAKDIIKGTSISTVVSFYHPINRKGGNFEAVCPFHGDTHPSLKINDNKGIYKCFACGAAGDAIKFVQDKINVSFIDAIKDIAGNLGITIEEEQGQNKNPKFDMALKVLKVANKIYKKVATETKPIAFQNFIKSRHLNEQSIQDFQIGYSPANNGLLNYLESLDQENKVPAINTAKEIGLIRDNKHGNGQYDFYRDRVMFPVWDHSGKVRGFSSRAVLPDQKPKYLNSGESFIFDKGNILYGYNLARKPIRELDQVIVVEGNMDVITLHQFGFKNSVGTMGVSLSKNSIRLLSNMTQNIYLGMDSDPAGIKAMTRINNDFLSIGIIPKFIDFHPSKDPDEFLHEQGRIKLSERIENAPSFIDYLIKKSIPTTIPQHTDKKLQILNETFKILAPLGASLHANEKVISTAKALSLASSHEDIINEYKKFLSQETSTTHKPNTAKTIQQTDLVEQGHDNTEEHDASVGALPIQIDIPKVERLVLTSLLTHPEMILNKQITEILDLIEHFEVKRIVQWLKNIYLEIDEAEFPLFAQKKMSESLTNEIKSIMATSLYNHTNIKMDAAIINKMLADYILKLKVEKLKRQRETFKLAQKGSLSDEDGLKYLKEIQLIENELLVLRNK